MVPKRYRRLLIPTPQLFESFHSLIGFFDEFRISTAMSPARDASTLLILTELIGMSLSLMELYDEFVDLTFIVPSRDPVEGSVAVTQP